MSEYFSDRELGPRARTVEEISPSVWGGVVAQINSLVSTGAFGATYPAMCPDGAGAIGTDESSLALALLADIPSLTWPLETARRPGDSYYSAQQPYAPDTLAILDLIEFCFRSIGKPTEDSYHKFFGHHHLSFDVHEGRSEFRSSINRIFARNGVAYELGSDGRIVRLATPVLRERMAAAVFRTGDPTLDSMLENSRLKFLNPDPLVRRESLERLWDCWERLKSIENPENKRQSVEQLLLKASDQAEFRDALNTEAQSLTNIGNSFHIRHTEVSQTMVMDSAHVDYLFHRLYAMIYLLLSKRVGRH